MENFEATYDTTMISLWRAKLLARPAARDATITAVNSRPSVEVESAAALARVDLEVRH
jgi:hypothetical protein